MWFSASFQAILLRVVAPLVAMPVIPGSVAHAALPAVSPDLTWGVSPANRVREVRDLRRAGVKWVRLTLNWDLVEPKRGVWSRKNLKMYFGAVRASRRAGLNIVMLVSRSPRWASGSPHREAPPREPRDYANFVHSLARRFGPSVEAYEIWNEENQSRFWPVAGGPNPTAYTALLKAAYPAIKSANPNAIVVFGGVTNAYHFLDRAYAAGAGGYFDVMADHPYSCSLSPNSFTRSVTGRIQPSGFLAYREIHRVMVNHGDGAKQIWFTEFGWSTTTNKCGVTARQQAAYLTRAYQLMSRDSYVGIGFWYDWRNNYPYHDADTYQARFGLLNSKWMPKPAYTAFVRYATSYGATALHTAP